jgi:hypothetical protein
MCQLGFDPAEDMMVLETNIACMTSAGKTWLADIAELLMKTLSGKDLADIDEDVPGGNRQPVCRQVCAHAQPDQLMRQVILLVVIWYRPALVPSQAQEVLCARVGCACCRSSDLKSAIPSIQSVRSQACETGTTR